MTGLKLTELDLDTVVVGWDGIPFQMPVRKYDPEKKESEIVNDELTISLAVMNALSFEPPTDWKGEKVDKKKQAALFRLHELGVRISAGGTQKFTSEDMAIMIDYTEVAPLPLQARGFVLEALKDAPALPVDEKKRGKK